MMSSTTATEAVCVLGFTASWRKRICWAFLFKLFSPPLSFLSSRHNNIWSLMFSMDIWQSKADVAKVTKIIEAECTTLNHMCTTTRSIIVIMKADFYYRILSTDDQYYFGYTDKAMKNVKLFNICRQRILKCIEFYNSCLHTEEIWILEQNL